jgi:hypothetical protein
MNSTKQPLTKLTVNLIPRAGKALDLATLITGDSKTDTVNRALQLYTFVMHEINDGNEIWIKKPDGSTEKIVLT